MKTIQKISRNQYYWSRNQLLNEDFDPEISEDESQYEYLYEIPFSAVKDFLRYTREHYYDYDDEV